MRAEEAYGAAKKYTDDSLEGVGAIAGKPCQIKSITDITGGHRITFSWVDNSSVEHTQTMDVMDGEKGDKGDKGDKGNTGDVGATGPRGQNGTAATVRVGAVTSGVSPSVTNSGTAQDAVLDFILPKGDRGEKGDKGEDGQNGSSFSIRSRFATYEELVAAFPDGPEHEGDAYFVGTTASPDLYIWLVEESEWHNNGPIAGVKGDKGDQGDEGFSPIANVTKNEGISTITIRDKVGTTTAQVKDGYSPSVDVSKEGEVITVEVTNESGTTEQVLDFSGKVNKNELGTAAYENVTNYVSPGNDGIPKSSSVYSAITSAVYGAYHPSGSKTIAELTSDLLILANIGNVYKITEDGETTALFIGGAGQTIHTGDNAVVVYGGDNNFLFDLQSGSIDLTPYQTKELPSGANIEDVIPSDASASNKLVTAEITGGNNGAFLNTTPILTYLRSLPITIKIASFNVSPSYAEVTDKIDTVHWFQYICNRAGDSAQEWTIHATSLDGTLEYIGKIQSSTTEISWQKLVTESDIIVKKGTWEGNLTLYPMGDAQTRDRFNIPITFDSPMPDFNYTVVIEFFESRYVTIRSASKTASGFHIEGANADNNQNSTLSKITWTAIRFPS